jgi:hypothetical protein
VSDSVFYRHACRCEQIENRSGDPNAGFDEQLESLIEDTLDKSVVEKFEFGSHDNPLGKPKRKVPRLGLALRSG